MIRKLSHYKTSDFPVHQFKLSHYKTSDFPVHQFIGYNPSKTETQGPKQLHPRLVFISFFIFGF